MCGITGYFNVTGEFNSSKFASANNIIRHRGPDDFGYLTVQKNGRVNQWKDQNLSDYSEDETLGCLGFRRLSIIDLSDAGHQPMTDSSGNLWIVFNGEIYNYIELRTELQALGYSFKSKTDTEVIINAYHEWGTDCLKRFNGMWAFTIIDVRSRTLFCARDRMGIKPFYYYTDKHTFAFGSEIKQLLELFPEIINKVNDRLIFDFLALKSYGNESSDTYFSEIKKLSPASFFLIQLDTKNFSNIKETVWWNLPDESLSIETPAIYNRIYDLLEDSVKLRLRSDVPQGTALSGGLDSSALVALVDIINGGNKEANKVFTIKTDDKSIDDGYFAELLTKNIKVTSYAKTFEKVAQIEEVEKLLWHQEEPIQTASLFGSWELYKFFREQGVTVNLDGQGADELLYGYDDFPFRNFLAYSLSDYGLVSTQKSIQEIANLYGCPVNKLWFQAIYGRSIHGFRNFKSLYKNIKTKKEQAWLGKEFFNTQKQESLLWNENFLQDTPLLHTKIRKKSFELLRHTNLPGILRQVDRNSMAFSVEARLPYLDYRLVELLFSLPAKELFRKGFTKYPLRRAMEGKLPQEVLWRKNKVGFNMPEFEILSKNKPFVKEVISTLKDDPLICYSNIVKNLDFLLVNKKNYDNMVWRFFVYALWKKQFGK